jgi:hypothetical protein
VSENRASGYSTCCVQAIRPSFAGLTALGVTTPTSSTSENFMRRGVIIKTVINGLTFDGSTTDPMQQAVRDALIAFRRPHRQVGGLSSPLRMPST